MSVTIVSVVFLSGIYIVLPVFILWARDRIDDAKWKRDNPPGKIAKERKVLEERLLKPDWVFYEKHLQRPVPEALRQLYSDRSLIIRQTLDYPNSPGINTFEPLDQEGLLDTQPWLGVDVVGIARTGDGDVIYLRPGSLENDIVYIAHHDGGDTGMFAESVAKMVEYLNRSNPTT